MPACSEACADAEDVGVDFLACRCAACCTLPAISCVAAPCCSTAAAIWLEISSISAIVPPIDLDGVDGFAGGVLDVLDLRGDFLGRLGGLIGQRLDFARHHGKSPAVLAGARRLDRGVQGEQIGLAGDVLDQRHHLADLLGAGRQAPRRRCWCGALRRRPWPRFRAERVTCWAMLLIDAVSSSVADATVSTLVRSLVRGGGGGGRLACGFRIAAAHGR